jgi:hypothetical protein
MHRVARVGDDTALCQDFIESFGNALFILFPPSPLMCLSIEDYKSLDYFIAVALRTLHQMSAMMP